MARIVREDKWVQVVSEAEPLELLKVGERRLQVHITANGTLHHGQIQCAQVLQARECAH